MTQNPDIPGSRKIMKTPESIEKFQICLFGLSLMLLMFVCRFMVILDLLDPCTGTFRGYLPNKMHSD